VAQVTLKHVAARAGVSHQTVSNVLNGINVKSDTLRRVKAAMRELDYHPNFAAKALREAKAKTVTLAFFEQASEAVRDPYRNLVQAAVTHGTIQHGYSLLSTFVYSSGKNTLESLSNLHKQKRSDGTLLVGLFNDPDLLEELKSLSIPVVLFDYCGQPTGFPTVTAQYAEGIAEVVAYLVGLGKRNLALISASDQFTTRIERDESFWRSVHASGVRGEIYRGDWSYASGEAVFRQLWAQDNRPDAILANDSMAIGCLAVARELGVRIPEDVLVTGFDDFDVSRYVTPPLTTVHVPFAEMAQEALRQLIDHIEHPDLEPTVQRFPVQFVRRKSA
jgi:LacI family transcriptional regulator